MNGTLQQRIDEVDQRLLARQQQLRQHWQALGLRVERATAPRRLVAPLLVSVFSLLAAGWLLRRVGARRVSEPVPRGERAAGAGWRLFDPLAGVRGAVALWPLLPAQWRARAGPGTAWAFIALGLPLVEGWLRRTPD